MSINRAILLGNVGRDAEVRTMGNGDKVASFSIATSETWRDKATGDRKEAIYVRKGTKVGIEGAIKTRTAANP